MSFKQLSYKENINIKIFFDQWTVKSSSKI